MPSRTRSFVTELAKLFHWHFFQVNPNQAEDKVDPVPTNIVAPNQPGWPSKTMLVEFAGVFVILAMFAFTMSPGVNESHYLTKAKQFWNPSWCTGDIFLESADAHYFFFVSCGWLTKVFSLGSTAWIGRVICWLGFAAAWVFLNHRLTSRPWFSILSAAIFMLLSSHFDMAGEWVVGGFEAKSVAYIFVVLGIGWYLRKQLAAALVAIGFATAMHAVVGGWAILCLLLTVTTEALLTRSVSHLDAGKHTKRQWFGALGLFALLVAVGCLPPIMANAGTEPTTTAIANYVQVRERLAHHLLFQQFPALHVGRFGLLVAIWLLVTRTVFISREFQRLAWFCNASLLISLIGIVLSGLSDAEPPICNSANALLRYYWFRFSDFAIPLGLSLFAVRLFKSLFESKLKIQRIAAWISAILLVAASLTGIVQNTGDLRAGADQTILPTYEDSATRTWQSYENWKKACHWIKNNTRSDSVFLTPVRQQTFKWYAHRAEMCCWKDMPQDANSVVQWRKRVDVQRGIERLAGGALALTDVQLKQLAKDLGVTHLLIEQFHEDGIKTLSPEPKISSMLTRIYPSQPDARSTYVVYRINQ